MLAFLGLDPDIVFVISKLPTHTRAAAYGTTDDDARGGVTVLYNGGNLTHRYFHRIPGIASIYVNSRAMTPAHEFDHAFSSYTNGFVTDHLRGWRRRPEPAGGAPNPQTFCDYNDWTYLSDLSRDGVGYPGTWQSYHAELLDPARPDLMDNYWLASGGPMSVRHGALTKAYVLARIAAKVSR